MESRDVWATPRAEKGGNGSRTCRKPPLMARGCQTTNLVLALAIAAWETERARALASSLDHGASGDGGMASLLAWV
jgi:hypothetical protein